MVDNITITKTSLINNSKILVDKKDYTMVYGIMYLSIYTVSVV